MAEADDELTPLSESQYEVWDAICRDDLVPLSRMLKSGEEIPALIRDEIANAIDHGLIIAVPDKQIPRAGKHQARNDEIGAWIAARKYLTPRGSMKRIVKAAAEKFGISEVSCRHAFLQFAGRKTGPWAEGLGMPKQSLFWQEIKKFCAERGLDYYEVHRLAYEGQKELVKKIDLKF